MRVGFHPEADFEFSEQIAHYETCEPGLGRRFYSEVMTCIDWITRHPAVPRERKGHRRVNLPIFPYYVAYLHKEDAITVLAIGHSRRRPEYWKHRAKGKFPWST